MRSSKGKTWILIQFLLFHLVLLPILLFVSAAAQSTGDETSVPMEDGEKASLYSAVQALVGEQWNGSSLYPDPCGWSPIQGVSCDMINGFWYVTGIAVGPVHDNSLLCSSSAGFSAAMFSLRHLRSISLLECFTSSPHFMEIPSVGWENLAGSLEVLEIRRNPKLVGGIPDGFGGLKNLKSLVVSDNGLSGTLPATLGGLAALERLVVSGNNISGKIPSSIGQMKQLLILDLSRNGGLSGSIPTTLGSLESLLLLDLSDNSLYGQLPSELGGMKSLAVLNLHNNSFSKGLPESMANLVLLEELILSDNRQLGNCMGVEWKKLTSLASLDLSGAGCTGLIPDSLSGLKKLRHLALSNNQFTGDFPQKIADIPTLNSMHLSGNNLSGEVGFRTEFVQRLGRRLSLWGNPNLCYTSSDSDGNNVVPFGVKQCDHNKGILSDGTTKHQLGEVLVSHDFNSGKRMNIMDIFNCFILLLVSFFCLFHVEEYEMRIL